MRTNTNEKTILRTLSILLIVSFRLTPMAFASARRASNFIFSCNAYSSSTGNGGVKISFEITGTGTMTSIGVTQIDIKNSAGTIVKTL